MKELREEHEWFGHRLEKVFILGVEGNRIPCNCIWPKDLSSPVPWMLTTHGAVSSKYEWTEIDGFTKGGNITRELVASGIAVVAMDLRYHGENDTQRSPGLNVFEGNNWERFFKESIEDIYTVIAHFAADPALDPSRMGYAGYSMAGIFGFWLANQGAPFKAMALCVPSVDRGRSSIYSTFNNLQNVSGVPVLQISAENDEYVPFEEAKWLFDQIPVGDKKFLSYPSGHSLPSGYVPEYVHWMLSKL
jgi:pimeloyl-ACP methyl ester carboxylesterase